MVNTFLTYGPNDVDSKSGKSGFRLSAAQLDEKRLWKQVVEANQILNLVKNYHRLGDYFKMPCPKNPYQIKAWTKELMKKYNTLNKWMFKHQGKWIWYSKNNTKPEKLKYDDTYQIQDDGTILYKNKVYSKYKLILPDDIFVTMGFGYHPVVIMWMQHQESLKLYINCHIEEFLSRGGKPETRQLMYSLSNIDKIIHPIWTQDSMFHMNHRAALLTKEIVRKEKPWYIHKKEFKIAYDYYIDFPPETKIKTTSSFEYYIWVFTQDIDDPRYKVNIQDGRCIISFKNYSKSKKLILPEELI